MKKKTQRLVVILLAAALLLSVVVPALSIVARADVTQSDIQNIKDELADIQAQKKATEARLAAIRSDLSSAREQVELIQGQVVLTEAQINASQALLDEFDRQIAGKELEIQGLEQQEEAQYQEFYRQVRWMEETGGVNYLSILFEAKSFADMLDYAMLIGDIMDYSNRIIDQLEATQRELGAARDELAADRAEQAAAQQELEAHKAELDVQRANAQDLLNQIAATESEYAAEAKQLADTEAQVNKQLKDAQTKIDYLTHLKALPGRYHLSSLFGSRKDPISGLPANHTGTDIPAPRGTPIYAAKTGVVTTVNTNYRASSYGYYCIISHGNGYATLYAHQNQVPIVKEGQTVQKGQIIGYVGTTGRSTGYHLHFELRINGVRNDIIKLYPGMTFTATNAAGKRYNIPGGK